MDGRLESVARDCLNASYDATMTFPQIVGKLIAAGFEGYEVDYRRGVTTYYEADGGSVTLENRPSKTKTPVAATFDQPGVAALIKWAQSGAADYSYADFCSRVKERGCAGYVVSFPGKRVLYYGRTAETHVEHFPQ